MTEAERLTEAYRCPHCRKLYVSQCWADRHVRHCWNNPNREPKLGEITVIDWHEPLVQGGAPWYPGKPGLCYTPDGWQAVPGYSSEPDSYIEAWPVVRLPGTGESQTGDYPGTPDVEVGFNELSYEDRIHYWDELLRQHGEMPGKVRYYVGGKQF